MHTIFEFIPVYNPSNIFARARLVKTRHVTQYAPTKIGEYPSDIPQFKWYSPIFQTRVWNTMQVLF